MEKVSEEIEDVAEGVAQEMAQKMPPESEDFESDSSLENAHLPTREMSEESLFAPPFELGIRAKISAILFVSTRPVPLHTLADAVGCDVVVVEAELQRLKELLDPAEFGFGLEEVAECWQFRSSSLAASVIARLTPPKAKRLSKAASETLAVIAYKQPVGKADIDSIRGVDSVPTLRTLLDLKLIRAVGRSNTPGHPVLYGTTTFFS